ncbi:Het-C-domain-containing protein [Hymenopellis radicata]|nr:Het-C-domain-containing protein [Hymenopellis radicata]
MGKSKFGGLDIKRIYFGNWLRDYSQAVDIAGLKKLPLQTIVNLCMALGFLAHGYATNEFEVTAERLACYLPTEHIDNPKGYGEGEDARKYHPGLRGPVDPRELEVDPRTGMKNYIANESGGWDTSKALVRRTLERCIHHGRQHRANAQKADLYESYRLLGTALHTLEDFSAHSNFCELALVAMGHTQVFTHVGDQVRIQAGNGRWVAPIVTGTFGSSDFIHSLLGEAGDKLSEASVSDLNKKMAQARSTSSRSPGGPSDSLRMLFGALPGGAGADMSREMDNVERIRAGPAQGGKRPEDMTPQELHSQLWAVLSFRDSVVKKIEKTIEKIPGLGPLIEKLMEAISVFVFSTLEPLLKPILQTATTGLSTASAEVIDNHDQYEVFNDPRASDPTHSFLSKDHFNLILNEPAGLIAKVVLIHTVGLVTKAWDDPSANVQQVTEDALQCLFHPDFQNRNSKVQNEMMQCLHKWYQDLGKRQQDVLRRLTKESVRSGNNKRLEGEGGKPAAEGTFAANQAHSAQQKIQGYASSIPIVGQATSFLGGGAGNRREGGPGDVSYGGGYPGAQAGGHSHGSEMPTGGQASSYYGGSSGSSYAPPPGPPPTGSRPSSYTPSGPSSYAPPPTSSYAPPSGPPPPHHAGYSPSYINSSSSPPSFPGGTSSPPPTFPGGAPSFPGEPSFPGAVPYGHGSPPPSFPPAPGFPDAGPGGFGGAPGFPGAGGHSQYQPPPHFPQAPPYGGGSGW